MDIATIAILASAIMVIFAITYGAYQVLSI
jgi:hypothetical protein